MWFGKNELRLYLNRAKKFSIGGRSPSKYAQDAVIRNTQALDDKNVSHDTVKM